jgi:DNA (cytosine-5)-methyltransferase 1
MTERLHNHVSPALSELERAMIFGIPPGGNWRDIPDGLSSRVDQIKRRSRERGLVHTTYYGRLRGDAPSYTINTYFSRIGNGCFLHPSQLRLISIREGARLQSFPDRVRFSGPRRSQYEQVGNAVPPLLARAVGLSLGGQGTVADLFAGAGGLSLGLEMAGFDIVYAAEKNPYACATFNDAHGQSLADPVDLSTETAATTVAKAIEKRAPDGLTLLAAGPPCQSFSTAGKRATDDRSGMLWFPFEVARLMQPRILLIENVQGILSAQQRSIPDRIFDLMTELGLQPSMHLLRAEEHGVPQRRVRVFFVGIRDSEWVPPPPTFSRSADALFPQPAVTVDEAIDDLPPLQPGDEVDDAGLLGQPRSEYQAWARGLLAHSEAVTLRAERLTTTTALVA